ncbi:MAG: transporter substrate-binding domain-containing protein [Oscillospiraceae bacterium]|nr:transporter substrate-binding domain-containing protein [Oscillospiraceae bacterium]
MKKILCLFITMVFILGLSTCGGTVKDLEKINEANVIKVGMECNYAPFNWTQSQSSDRTVPIGSGGYADGYDVQIARKIAEGLGVELEIVKIEWDGLTLALTSGKIDAIIAGMSPTKERKMTIDFSDAYYESELVIVVKKDSAYASAASLADFADAKITGQLNTFHYTVIDQIPNVKKQTALNDFPAMLVALQSGSIDGYVSEKPGAVAAMTANSDVMFIEFAAGKGFETTPDDVAIAVGLRKGSDLADEINKILKGISIDERESMMIDADKYQPLSEGE